MSSRSKEMLGVCVNRIVTCLSFILIFLSNVTEQKRRTNSTLVEIHPRNTELLKNELYQGILNTQNDGAFWTNLDDRQQVTIFAPQTAEDKLRNTTLKIGLVLNFPCASEDNSTASINQTNGKKEIKGFCLSVLEMLNESLGFQYEIKKFEEYSSKLDEDYLEMDGLVGELARSEIDMGLSYLLMTQKRKKYVSFSHPVENSRICTVIKQPGLQRGRGAFESFMAYVNIFDLPILELIIISLITSTIMISTCAIHSTSEEHNSIFRQRVYTFFTTCGIFFQQGVSLTPKSIPCRIAFWTTWCTSLVVYYSFSSKVTSVKIAVAASSPFHSLDDVINNNNYHILIRENGLVEGILQDANSTVDKNFRERLARRTASKVKSLDEGLNWVKNNDSLLVMLVEGSEALSIIDCSLLMGPVIHKENVHFGFPLNSTFKDVINSQIINLSESGHLRRMWNKLYKATKPNCVNISDVSSDIQETLGIFITVIIGISLSLTVLVNEILLVKFKASRCHCPH